MLKHILGICIIFSYSLHAAGQRLPAAASRISIRNNSGNIVPFTLTKEPKFRITNGVLSVAALSVQNEVFEITNIPVAYMKDTILSASSFKAILVTATTPFTSQLNDMNATVEIRCANPKEGERITLFINTPIYRNKTKYTVRATFRGKVPAQQNNTTH